MRDDDGVGVEGGAFGVFRIVDEFEAVMVPHTGAGHRGVENAGRAPKTEEDGVGTAGDGGALDVEIIGGILDLEKFRVSVPEPMPRTRPPLPGSET